MWRRVKPKTGVFIRVLRNDLAGGSSNSWVRAVGMILIAVAAAYTGGAASAAYGAGWGAAAAAGVTIAGTLALNALVPMSMPSTDSTSG